MLWTLGPFYGLLFNGHLVFFHVLVFLTKKNLATLLTCRFAEIG
jgi:hypothetical protein